MTRYSASVSPETLQAWPFSPVVNVWSDMESAETADPAELAWLIARYNSLTYQGVDQRHQDQILRHLGAIAGIQSEAAAGLGQSVESASYGALATTVNECLDIGEGPFDEAAYNMYIRLLDSRLT